MKTYNYKGREVYLKKSSYKNNNSLAVIMMDAENHDELCVITVNVPYSIADDCVALIDTNNCGDDLVEWLEENEIAVDMFFGKQSGFCTYPYMAFNVDCLTN